MPRTSTSFKPGHKGMGGRPKGPRNGPSNVWRMAAKSARDVGRRADEVQSGLMNRLATMSLAQLVKLAQVLRKRRAAHVHRSAHVRHIYKSGGFEIAFRNKVAPGRYPSPPTLTKRNRVGEQPDAGARRAAKKALELERDLEKVQEELCKPSETSMTKVAELTNAIAALDELSKAEKIFLGQSGDPRPVVIRRPFRIQLLGVPHDPLRPDYMGPARILGGLTPAEFYGGEEQYRAALEAYKKERISTIESDPPSHPTLKSDRSTVVIDGEEYGIMPDEMAD